MLQLVADRFGPPEAVLRLREQERPTPRAGEVVVRMLASAINPSDRLTICGAYPHRTRLPFVPGFEGVGILDTLGEGVAGASIGQRVLPLGSAGGWQTYKSVSAQWCLPVPEDLSDDEAALSYVNPLTAHLMIARLGILPDQSVGINAAASAIGRMLMRLIASRGGRPIAIVRSTRSADSLDGEPVATIVVGPEPIPSLDHGLDAIGGEDGARMAAAVRARGVFLYYGLLSGRALPSDVHRSSSATVELFSLRNWVHRVSMLELRHVMKEVFAGIRAGHLRTTVLDRIPLHDFESALARDAAAGRRGKVLLTS
jgi:NADPH:quinone reductase-like Zn-dependent oxidoreductase